MRSSTPDTDSRRAELRDRPVHAPPPDTAHQRLPSAGAETNPTTHWPSSMRPMSVAHTGTPRTKFLVPSIGSMTHWREECPVVGSSSPRTESRPRARPSCSRMTRSASLSASVTGVRSDLVSTVKLPASKRARVRLSTLLAIVCARCRSSRQRRCLAGGAVSAGCAAAGEGAAGGSGKTGRCGRGVSLMAPR